MPIWALCAGSTAVSGALGVAAHRTYDAGVADVGDDLDRVGRAEALTKLGFGGRSARVAGASCVRFDLPHPWATQACPTEVARSVILSLGIPGADSPERSPL